MAVIGCLGDIVFNVSDKTVLTLNNMQWSGSANYATHERHMDNALTEMTSIDPDKISFDIMLMVDLGINPMDEIVKLFDYKRAGAALPLTLGEHAYGKYRWTILSLTVKPEYYDSEGNFLYAKVSLSLQEYLNS